MNFNLRSSGKLALYISKQPHLINLEFMDKFIPKTCTTTTKYNFFYFTYSFIDNKYTIDLTIDKFHTFLLYTLLIL